MNENKSYYFGASVFVAGVFILGLIVDKLFIEVVQEILKGKYSAFGANRHSTFGSSKSYNSAIL